MVIELDPMGLALLAFVGAVMGAWTALAMPLAAERFGASLNRELLEWLWWSVAGLAIVAAALAIAVVVLAAKLRRERAARRSAAT